MGLKKTYKLFKEVSEDPEFSVDDIIILNDNQRIIELDNRRFDINFDYHVNIGDILTLALKKANVTESEFYDTIIFRGITFRNIRSFIASQYEVNVVFDNCNFNEISQVNYSCLTKVRFQNKCNIGRIRLRNVVFQKLFVIYNSTINELAVFAKVDFKDNVVFTRSIFKANLLFTYTTFEKLGIFSRAKFYNEKRPVAIDLSQSIVNGNLVFFETQIGNFKAFRIDSSSDDYEDSITKDYRISYQNKRETFRIIKHQLLQQNNVIEAEKYAKLEKQTFLEETNATKSSNHLILLFNRISNNFKTDYRNGISFTVLSLLVFTFLTFITSYEFWFRLCFECDFDQDTFNYAVKQLFVNLNPTHSFDYIDKLKPIYGLPYLFDFLGRIFIGYGIYQTIQAFRKFK